MGRAPIAGRKDEAFGKHRGICEQSNKLKVQTNLCRVGQANLLGDLLPRHKANIRKEI
jgi:hypothetical protein